MFILTTRFSKKRAIALLVILVGVILGFCVLLLPGETENEQPLLECNDDRVAYLQSLGWEVAPEPLETLQLRLPETLPENYAAYNQIQLAQGFDLTTCCGKQLTRYTYAVSNYPERPDGVQLNLYVCQQLPVAGDVIAVGADGFQTGLIRTEQQ